MSRPLALAPHHTEEELRQRYRAANDATERAHWQVIWLKKRGERTGQIAEATAYSPYWVRTLIRRYNAGGAGALRDRRHDHPGAPPMLDAAQQARPWPRPRARAAARRGEVDGAEGGPVDRASNRPSARAQPAGVGLPRPPGLLGPDATAVARGGRCRRAGGF